MSGLALPMHIARQRAAELRRAPSAPIGDAIERHQPLIDAIMKGGNKEVVNEIDTPIPDGLPEPQQWRIVLMPVRQRHMSKSGLLQMPPEYLDVQNWTHNLWKVCKVGPFVYRGPAWTGFSEDELEAQRPKVGDIYLVDPKAPRRFRYKGILFIVVNDDQLWSRVDRDKIDGLECQGLEL